MFRVFTILIIILLCNSSGFSQFLAGHIPASNREEWYKAGLQYKKPLKVATRFIDFSNDPDIGPGDNDDKIKNAIANISGTGLTIIYFPKGEYYFASDGQVCGPYRM